MRKKGQSTVEYVLLVTAVVGVVIVATMGNNNLFSRKLNSTINIVTDGMEKEANKITNMLNGS